MTSQQPNTEVNAELPQEPVMTKEEKAKAKIKPFIDFLRDTHKILKDIDDDKFVVTLYPHHKLKVTTVDIKVVAEGIDEKHAFTIPDADMDAARFAMATQSYQILRQQSTAHPDDIGQYRLVFNPQPFYFDLGSNSCEGMLASFDVRDYIRVDKAVERIGKHITDLIKKKAIYAIRKFVDELPKPHEYNLVVSWDFTEENEIRFCVDKVNPIHDTDETAQVQRTRSKPEDWLDAEGNPSPALVYLDKQIEVVNDLIRRTLNFNGTDTALSNYTKEVFDKVIFYPLYNGHSEIVQYNAPDGKDVLEQVDLIVGKLKELAGETGDVRLDLNSLLVYRWDVNGDYKLVEPQDVIQQFFRRYLQSFGNVVFNKLRSIESPYIRAHEPRVQLPPKPEVVEGEEAVAIPTAADLLKQSGLTERDPNAIPQINPVKQYMMQVVQMGIAEMASKHAYEKSVAEWKAKQAKAPRGPTPETAGDENFALEASDVKSSMGELDPLQ